MRTINDLKTIKNFATENKVTTSYIYKLIRDKKISTVIIDGVKFVDISETPSLSKA